MVTTRDILLMSTWCVFVIQSSGQIHQFDDKASKPFLSGQNPELPIPDLLSLASRYLRVNRDAPNPLPSTRVDCGKRNPEGVAEIKIGGTETKYGEFPWMVAILEVFNEDDGVLMVYKCGGSIIHPQVILTAAHCVVSKKTEDIKIRAGEWDTQTHIEPYPNQNRNVSRIIPHPEYYRRALFNDVALLILDVPLNMTEVVQPVCLPAFDSEADFDSSKCIVAGWGKDQLGNFGRYQVIMKQVEVPIVNRSQCQNDLRETALSESFKLHESFICAGGEDGKSPCVGDGGSPLVCPIAGLTDRYYQTGIVSWSVGCGRAGIPGLYGNVPHLKRWIDEQMDSLNFDTSYYTVQQ